MAVTDEQLRARSRDMLTHLEMNLGRARDQNVFVEKGGTVPCPKCGHRVALTK